MSIINKFLLLVLIVVVFFIGINLRKKSSNEISQAIPTNVTTQPQEGRLASQENEGGNVTVIVKPINFKIGEKPELEVIFETHSVDLDFDVSQVSNLSDDKGNVLTTPIWEGSSPGGHHRKGALTFNSPLTETKYVELSILNIAGVKERRFKWSL